MKRANTLRYLELRLQDSREKIILTGQREMKRFMSGEGRQIMGAGLEEGDLSEYHREEFMSLRRLAARRNMVAGIQDALNKLREGSYGVCEECGGDISEERLRVVPHAVLCVECQEEREKRWFKRN